MSRGFCALARYPRATSSPASRRSRAEAPQAGGLLSCSPLRQPRTTNTSPSQRGEAARVEPGVLGALIAAVTSVLVALIAAGLSAVNATKLLRLQHAVDEQKLRLESELAEQRAVGDARRDYEYEARKRLYEQCEPVLFRAGELADSAAHRIVSLAQSARRGDLLPDGQGWLAGPGYYSTSTAYLLLAPLTVANILQRRLTTVDLGLEPRLQLQYGLLKGVHLSLTADFSLAGAAPSLRYDPDRADPGEPARERLLRESPEVHRRQGLYFGVLDMVTEALLVDGGSRCMSFAEFLAAWSDPHSALHASAGDIEELFTGFHPRTRPVLWRVLVSQYLLHRLLMQVQQRGVWERDEVERLVTERAIAALPQLDWRSAALAVADREVREPIEAAREHVLALVRATEDRLVEW